MATDTESTTKSKPKRRWFRLTLRSMLVLVLLLTAVLGYTRHRIREKQRICNEIRELGGGFGTEDAWYEWIEEIVATAHWRKNGLFGELVSVDLSDTSVDDDWLRQLSRFKNLERLRFGGCKNVGDTGLRFISGLHNLQELSLYDTAITNDGLVHMQDLRQLRILSLAATQITDKGLRNIQELKNLEALEISDTKVTSEGIESLQKHLPNCVIF